MVLPPNSSAGHRLARAAPLWVVMPQSAATKGPQPCPYATLWRKEEVISEEKKKSKENLKLEQHLAPCPSFPTLCRSLEYRGIRSRGWVLF